jgi:YD repeat-containing protein
MKTLIAVLMLSGAVAAQERAPISEGPVFDDTGRLSAYVYADGKQEQYGYDPSWRLTRFVDRNGNITTFIYGADGAMTVDKPDGSTSH